MDQERRKAPRIAFHLKVRINGRGELGEMVSFTTRGAFIRTSYSSYLKEGDEIELIVRLPLEDNITRIKAQVVHVTNRGIGVKFKDLSPYDAADIKYCFDVFKNTLPLPST